MGSFLIFSVLIPSKEKLSILISATSCLLLAASVFQPNSLAALTTVLYTFLFLLSDTVVAHHNWHFPPHIPTCFHRLPRLLSTLFAALSVDPKLSKIVHIGYLSSLCLRHCTWFPPIQTQFSLSGCNQPKNPVTSGGQTSNSLATPSNFHTALGHIVIYISDPSFTMFAGIFLSCSCVGLLMALSLLQNHSFFFFFPSSERLVAARAKQLRFSNRVNHQLLFCSPL